MTRLAFGETCGTPAATCSLPSLSLASSEAVATSPSVFDKPSTNVRREIGGRDAFSIPRCSFSSDKLVKVQNDAGHGGVGRQSSKVGIAWKWGCANAAQSLRISEVGAI